MLHHAVRSMLDQSGGRAPSHDAWALVLVAAGVDPAEAVTLPQRLGYVFHIGRYDEHDVITQIDAWAAALRVRAQPETADLVEEAARRLREEPWLVSGPQPPPVGGAPDTRAPAATPAPSRSPVSGSGPPRVGGHPDTQRDPFGHPQQTGRVSGSPPQRPGQHPDSRRAFPGAPAVPGRGGPTKSSRPGPVVVAVVIGLILVGFCVVGLFAALIGLGP